MLKWIVEQEAGETKTENGFICHLPTIATEDGRYRIVDFGAMAWMNIGDQSIEAWRSMGEPESAIANLKRTAETLNAEYGDDYERLVEDIRRTRQEERDEADRQAREDNEWYRFDEDDE